MRILLLALIAATLMGCSNVEALEFTTIYYNVVAGDTMDSIARTYLPPDRGDSYRAYAEFREGIFEFNFDRVFIDRKPYEVHVGDCLLINYWK